jgi:hypothetical protein
MKKGYCLIRSISSLETSVILSEKQKNEKAGAKC